MILQPLNRLVHYGQAYRKRHSTMPSYKPPLHNNHPIFLHYVLIHILVIQ